MTTQEPSFVWWLFRKTFPGLILGSVLGLGIAALAKHSPDSLRWLAIGAALLFAGIFFLYSSWAARKQNSGGYVWHPLERVGIFCSGIGALLLSLKLGFPSLPRSYFIYLALAFTLAFVIRPVFDHYGWKEKQREKQQGT